LRRYRPDLDVVRVQDTELYGMEDPAVLEWAAGEGQVVLTHDVNTMPKYAYQRVAAGYPMPGVFIPLGQMIEEILMLVEYSREGEWEGQVLYLPVH
jgi:hypothetical protein